MSHHRLHLLTMRRLPIIAMSVAILTTAACSAPRRRPPPPAPYIQPSWQQPPPGHPPAARPPAGYPPQPPPARPPAPATPTWPPSWWQPPAPAPAAPPPAPMPAPGHAPPATTGGLIVSSSPTTDVLLNGRRVGRTPLTLNGLAAGSYELTFLFANDQVSLMVELAQGEYKKVHTQAAPP